MQDHANGITVHYPRLLTGPRLSLYNLEAKAYYLSVRRLVARLRGEFPFDLIHAYFSYPDGVVAARLARLFGVPVVVTEQVPWRPWMDDFPQVRRQALSADPDITSYVAVSRSVRDQIAQLTGSSERIRIVPNGVDGSAFSFGEPDELRDPNQILFVGFINHNKGVDKLLEAMAKLLRRRPDAHLVLVGGSFYRSARRQEQKLHNLAKELGLGDRVRFLGVLPPHEVAGYMRRSALLVLPSRAESFGAVLVEALACGTPVVATRCGGPEDIVSDEVGVLVPVGDSSALAEGLEQILREPQRYRPAQLRAYALERFSWERVAEDTVSIYHEAVNRQPAPYLGRKERASVYEHA
jgi:glycosyltransferase involved in cell wall biosynthesis